MANPLYDATKGSYDKYRKPPAGVDPAQWNAYIDELNKDFNSNLKFGGGDPAHPNPAKVTISPEDLLANFKKTHPTATAATKTPADEIADATADTIKQRNALLEGLGRAGLVTSQRYGQAAKETRENAGAANKEEQDALDRLTSQYFDLNKQDQNALANYLQATDPMMAEIFATASDPKDLQRQLDAYDIQKGAVDKYKELSDPNVTAKERYMSEVARREFEAADKSNREAVSEQLANRGLRSGGQQIAGQQQSQQQLSQDRLLKELGIQAGAVDRSMQALQGWSSGAAALGTAAGAIRDANTSEQQWRDTFRVNEAKRRSDLAGARKTASDTTTSQVGQRDQDIYQGGRDVAESKYKRLGDATSADIAGANFDYGNSGDYFTTATGVLGTNLQDLIHSKGIKINEDEATKEQDENPPL